MINLLPTDVKQNIAYARHNTRLLKWAVAFVVSLAGSGLVVLFGLFYINQSVNSLSAQAAKTNSQLQEQKLEETQKRVEEISSSLKLVTQVLSREILFSKLITQIGAAMPANTSLSDLKISKVEGGIDLSAIAATYNDATQVQVNLQDKSNKIFDKVDILNVACSSATTDPKYPCTITMRAQFVKDNPFLFINTKGAKP